MMIIGADEDKKIYFITYPANTSTSITPPADKRLYTIDFALDSTEFVAGGQSGYILFYYANNNSAMKTIVRDSNNILSLRYSSNTSYLLAAKENGQIDIYKKYCQDCILGTYQSTTGCTSCGLAMTACIHCRNSSECLACSSGYYLDTGTKVCEPCSLGNGCVACESSTVCVGCSQEYYLNGATCSRCDSAMTGC